MTVAVFDLLRILIGVLLTYAAIAKFRAGRVAVGRAIAGYRILPAHLALRSAPVLIAVEVVTGFALIVDEASPWPALAAIALLGLLTVALVEALRRRLRRDCGCGGALSGPIRWQLVVRNLVLMAAL